MKNNLILVGYSGHAFGVIECLLDTNKRFDGYVDKTEKIFNPFGIPYIGNDEILLKSNFVKNVHIAFGNLTLRREWLNFFQKEKLEFQTIISLAANISKFANIGEGTFIAQGVNIGPFVHVGRNCILNTSCSIDHEVKIGNNSHIAPGAVLAGGVIIGDNTLIGANSIIKENVVIGNNAIIGAGSVVLNNVTNNKKVVGNPAKSLDK